MATDRKQKVFVLGVPRLAGVASADWLDTLPNLADYDHVLVSTRTLNEVIERYQADVLNTKNESRAPEKAVLQRLSVLKKRLQVVREYLIKVLVTGGSVSAIVHPIAGIAYREQDNGYPKFILANLWQPLEVNQIDEPGDTLEVLNQQATSYFKAVRSWTKAFSSDVELGAIEYRILDAGLSGSPVIGIEKLAVDRQGNAVGQSIAAYHGGRNNQPTEPLSGLFTVLVPPTEISDEEAIDILLQDRYGIRVASTEPEWITALSAPGETELREQIGTVENELASATSRLTELGAELSKARSPLRVLYEQHMTLQDACEDLFNRVGIATKPSPVSDEFMLKLGDLEALVEVTGTKKSASLRDLSQLYKDIGSFLNQEDRAVKGLLVVNVWIGVQPDKRIPPDHRPFPENVVDFAMKQGIALLDTRDLYRAYEANYEGTLKAVDFFNLLISTAGVVTVAPSPASA